MGSPEPSAAERLAVLRGPEQPDFAEVVQVVRDGDGVIGETELPDLGPFTFEATQIRSTRTGPHARIDILRGIGQPTRRIAYDVVNTDRDSARRDLASAGARALGENRWGPVGQALKVRLDAFCDAFWACHVAGSEGQWVKGCRDARPGFLLEPYLLDGGGTILFGPPGSTKSYIAMIWALGITHGVLPWSHRQTPVLLVNLERDATSVSWRTSCIASVLGCEPSVLAINRRGYTLSAVHEAVLATVKRHDVGLVIVDSLSRAGTGSLTDDEDSNRAMDMLNALGVSWCILAHTPRADTTHEYGSVMQSAAADRTVRCTAQTDSPNRRAGVQLEVCKANDRGKGKPEVFTLAFDTSDDLCGFHRASPGEWPDLTLAAASPLDLVLEYLDENGSATTTEIATETALQANQVRSICSRSDRIVRLDGGGGRGNAARWGRALLGALSE